MHPGDLGSRSIKDPCWSSALAILCRRAASTRTPSYSSLHQEFHNRVEPTLAWTNGALFGAGKRVRGRGRLGHCLPSKGVMFASDSPMEEAGFELSVPPAGAGLFATNGTEITGVRE